MASPTPSAHVRAILRQIPTAPGVYLFRDANRRVLYVGKANVLRNRVRNHFGAGGQAEAGHAKMVGDTADIEYIVTDTIGEAYILEGNLIKEHRPRFNVMLRDDKSYPYILLETQHRFPRLSFYRGPRTAKGRLFGPYPNAGSVRESLNQLHKLFQLRQCEDSYFENRSRPCMQHQIERCTAPCVGLISEEDYARDLEHAVLFLEGQSDVVTARLAERMEQAEALAAAQVEVGAARGESLLAGLEQQGGQLELGAGLLEVGQHVAQQALALVLVGVEQAPDQRLQLAARARGFGERDAVAHPRLRPYAPPPT